MFIILWTFQLINYENNFISLGIFSCSPYINISIACLLWCMFRLLSSTVLMCFFMVHECQIIFIAAEIGVFVAVDKLLTLWFWLCNTHPKLNKIVRC